MLPGSSFNGAATFQSRTPSPPVRGSRAWPGFNGAATFQSRTRRTQPLRRHGHYRFNGAATFQSRTRARTSPIRVPMPRFNGAATFQSRTRADRPRARGIGSASMGPRPFSRGHADDRLASLCRDSWLQWGRDLSVADTPYRFPHWPLRACCFNGAATFQSRTRSSRHRARAAAVASMGPRPFSRGHAKPLCRRGPLLPCFNGAATFQSRTLVNPGHRDSGYDGFNGAATFQSRTRAGRDRAIPSRAGFNGAATFQSRTLVNPGHRDSGYDGFNGAATFQSRTLTVWIPI